jgi:hypothetical protein
VSGPGNRDVRTDFIQQFRSDSFDLKQFVHRTESVMSLPVSMIVLAFAGPIPGRPSKSAAVAEFKSTVAETPEGDPAGVDSGDPLDKAGDVGMDSEG